MIGAAVDHAPTKPIIGLPRIEYRLGSLSSTVTGNILKVQLCE